MKYCAKMLKVQIYWMKQVKLNCISDLHEVISNVLRPEAFNSVSHGLSHIHSHIFWPQPAEVCKEMSGFLIQKGRRAWQYLYTDGDTNF